MRSLAGYFCFSAALATFAGSAQAEHLDWMNRTYEYVVINQDIRGALAEFGRNMHVPVLCSDRVRGSVRGDVRAKTAIEFLERLADGNGLVWYFDGSVLHVSLAEESITEIVNLGRIDGTAVIDEVRRLNLMEDRFRLEIGASPSALRISGPPAFVAVVRQVIKTIEPTPQLEGSDPRVRVFRGKRDGEVAVTAQTRQGDARSGDAVTNSVQQPSNMENQEK
ncbi:type III secretion protein [Ensifer sp. ENS02]|uniref:type III secretion protein n=1 Tax=Ensifer sp. ENS02 TaxID=2769290 RepID=UPI0017870A70|nr:type III secretion protein [Ensifer sp. ENS02]MBD9524732.1 type III secretion protein [Ensifer sp. ENS02]